MHPSPYRRSDPPSPVPLRPAPTAAATSPPAGPGAPVGQSRSPFASPYCLQIGARAHLLCPLPENCVSPNLGFLERLHTRPGPQAMSSNISALFCSDMHKPVLSASPNLSCGKRCGTPDHPANPRVIAWSARPVSLSRAPYCAQPQTSMRPLHMTALRFISNLLLGTALVAPVRGQTSAAPAPSAAPAQPP